MEELEEALLTISLIVIPILLIASIFAVIFGDF